MEATLVLEHPVIFLFFSKEIKNKLIHMYKKKTWKSFCVNELLVLISSYDPRLFMLIEVDARQGDPGQGGAGGRGGSGGHGGR